MCLTHTKPPLKSRARDLRGGTLFPGRGLGWMPALVGTIGRLLLAATLLTASVGKLLELAQDPLVSSQPVLIVALSLVELWAGITLVSRRESRIRFVAWAASAALGVAFWINYARAWFESEIGSCGCLGVLQNRYISHTALLLFYTALQIVSAPSLQTLQKTAKINHGDFRKLIQFLAWGVAFLALVSFCLVAPGGRMLLGLRDPPVQFVKCKDIDCGVIRLGDLPLGVSRRCSVEVVNTGSETVRILGHQSSCSCSAAQNLPTSLQPGETHELEFRYLAKGDPGPRDTSMLVYLDSYWQKKLVIRLTATVNDTGG